jgi:hypothetical protein
MRKALILFTMAFFYAEIMPAQTHSLTIGTGVVCAAQEVLVPVTAVNIMSMGALTLFIGFDTTRIKYKGLVNIDPQLSQMNYNYITSPPQLAFSWSSTTGANFPETKFFDIKFSSNGEQSGITFLQGCEIANINLTIIPTDYITGGVQSGIPVISQQPMDSTVKEWRNVDLNVSSPNATSYSWKESKDFGATWNQLQDAGIYSGTHTNRLLITQVPVILNNYRYLCTLTKDICSINSNAAILHVDSVLSVGAPEKKEAWLSQNQPNPFYQKTRIGYYLPENGYIKIKIFDTFGREISSLVNTGESKGEHSATFDGNGLPEGIYFYCLEFQHRLSTSTGYRKMIKLNF